MAWLCIAINRMKIFILFFLRQGYANQQAGWTNRPPLGVPAVENKNELSANGGGS